MIRLGMVLAAVVRHVDCSDPVAAGRRLKAYEQPLMQHSAKIE